MNINIKPSNNVSIVGFTKDQQKAYNELLDFINAPYSKTDYKRALVGAAGTGKTFLVRALIKNSKISYSTIGLAAPTHKACRVLQESIALPNIKVNTLQSDLGLRLNFDVEKFDINNPPFDPKGRIKIGDYKLYIIDEASMINVGLRMFLERTCTTNNCKILYIGDDSQLPPVKEKYSTAFKGIKLHVLREIVRQGEDNPISYLLELLRDDIKNKTFKFLEYISKNPVKFNSDNTKGYEVCDVKTFGEKIYINFTDDAITRNIDYAKIIAYTNANVGAWNKFIRSAIIEDADKSIITKNDLFISYVTIVNQFNEAIIKNSEEYIVKDVVNYTHPRYDLKGFMVRLQAIHGGQVTNPLFILDHTDKFTIQMYVKISEGMVKSAKMARANIRAQKWREYYKFKESCMLLTNIGDSRGNIIYSRDLDYGFALTSHKSQGSTFDTSFVDVIDIVYDKYGHPYTDVEDINRRLYVAASRCRNKLYLKFKS